MVDYFLNLSMTQNRKIVLIYQKDDEITERTIKVKKIYDDKIEAYCYLRKEIRFFKKENILSAGFTKEEKYFGQKRN